MEIPELSNSADAMTALLKPADEPKQDDEPKPDDKKEGDEPKLDNKPGDEPDKEEPDPFDSEVDAVELHPGASDKSKSALSVLKGRAKEEHKARIAAEKKATEIEAAKQTIEGRITELESKVLTPEQEKELTDLRQFRDTFGLESDPSVTKPFDDRVAAASAGAVEVLKAIAVPEATLKYIEAQGGLYNFRQSDQLMPEAVKNPDGSRMTQSQFYKKFIESHLTVAQKEELSDAYAEIRRAGREKKAKVDDLRTNRDRYTKERQAAIETAKQDWVKRVTDRVQKVLPTYGEAATLKEIPQDASPEEKARLEKHNAAYKQAEAKFQQVMSQVTPENLTEAALALSYQEILKGENADLKSRLKAAEDERDKAKQDYDDLRNAGKTSDIRTGVHTKTTPKVSSKTTAEEAMTKLVRP